MRKPVLGFMILALAVSSGFLPTSFAQEGYSVTIVGGVDAVQSYPDQTVEGFTFSDLTFRSRYPEGMELTATITPPEGVTISEVRLPYVFTNTGNRGNIATVSLGTAPNTWVATLYELRGMTPWHEIEAQWDVRTSEGESILSEPVRGVYYDATREWYRAESEDIVVYWFGVSDDLGQYVIEAMAGNRETYHQGFGVELPYRPVAVIYPPGGIWNEYKGDTTVDDTNFGSTGTIIPAPGSTIQRVRTLEPAEIRADCIWNPENPDETFQFNQAASTTVHEVAHLYQTERGVNGPSWWLEGQATFFETFTEYPVHDRLRKLGEIRGDFPTFQGDGPGGGPYTAAEDGCTHLIYDMGSSFMLWLVDAYGGLDVYRAIVDEMAKGYTLEQTLDRVLGKTLLDLENEWRAFLGFGPVPEEILDPGLALDDPAEPFYAEGESVLMPANAFQILMYSRPSEQSTVTGSCFANTPVTVLRAGNDGVVNWYEVDCMGQTGWMNQGQMAGAQ
jgi:hypothetical protein